MEWVKYDETIQKPVKSWCKNLEDSALEQAKNLANHPVIARHVALMPDCHMGYGMPIGGVIACKNAVIPNAVGVDIGCGMGAVRTNYNAEKLKSLSEIRQITEYIKKRIPVGEGHAHKTEQEWNGFNEYIESLGITEALEEYKNPPLPGWLDKRGWTLAKKNLGTLGGGNHFIELQKSQTGEIWLMLHSGSRNLGYRIAKHYHTLAVDLNNKWHSNIPTSQLAFLPADHKEGENYIRDMNFALEYARENRRRMMNIFKEAMEHFLPGIEFTEEINIHHNYAALEHHFDQNLWVHRKGATSAKEGEPGIIPGSMGTSSYIVRGKGNPESFQSCSHGAGRKMGRLQACRTLTVEECNDAMKGIVFDRWNKIQKQKLWDLGESPLAYKDIDQVIQAEMDLIEPVVKLSPLGVIKG